MADLNKLNELHIAVRSQILEHINNSLKEPGGVVAATQYTKSDGTNYGMYQKSDDNLTDLWDRVINQGPGSQLGTIVGGVIKNPTNR